jgi:hypothetical protein
MAAGDAAGDGHARHHLAGRPDPTRPSSARTTMSTCRPCAPARPVIHGVAGAPEGGSVRSPADQRPDRRARTGPRPRAPSSPRANRGQHGRRRRHVVRRPGPPPDGTARAAGARRSGRPAGHGRRVRGAAPRRQAQP